MHALRSCCLASAVLLAVAAERVVEQRDDLNHVIAQQLVAIVRDPAGSYPIPARVAAARALGAMGSDAGSVVVEVLQMLSDPYRNSPLPVEEALAQAAGQLGPAGRVLIPALVANLGRDRDLDRALSASVAVLLQAPNVTGDVAVLIRGLTARTPAERLLAAKQLADLGPAASVAVPALQNALADNDPDVRRQALLALQIIAPAAPPNTLVIGVHVRQLSDDNPANRLAAVKALVLLGAGARPALPALSVAAKKDPDSDVRRLAADAVARLQQGR